MADTIEIGGLVDTPRTLDLTDLSGLPEQVEDISALAQGREGTAVALTAVLDAVGVRPEAAYITLEAEGEFAASIPLDAVREQAYLLYRLGDGPLPEEKGGPVRFLIPDPAACGTADVDQCANVKWLRRIVLSAERGRDVRPSTLRAHEALHEAERRSRS